MVFIIWQRRILQSDWSIWGPDFAVMPSAAIAGHYEIFNALQNKTEQNKTVKALAFFLRNVNRCKRSDDKHLEQTNFTTWGYTVQF